MPNKSYQQGIRKEYRLCKFYKGRGFDIVQRTAGSHSPFDIIAISKKYHSILLIQSKPDSISEKEEKKLYEESGGLDGLYRVKFRVR